MLFVSIAGGYFSGLYYQIFIQDVLFILRIVLYYSRVYAFINVYLCYRRETCEFHGRAKEGHKMAQGVAPIFISTRRHCCMQGTLYLAIHPSG